MKAINNSWRLILVLVLALTGCASGVSPTPAPAVASPSCPPVRIGAVVASADTDGGMEQRQGYEMALAEINQSGGLQTCPVELFYPVDGETLNPDSAQIAMLELVEQDVVAIVGATSTNATKRAAALAQYFKIPFIISSDTGDDVTLTGTQWLFRIPPQNKAYASTAFDMIKANMTGRANVAILYEHSEYGESAAVAAGNSVLNHGLNLVSYQGYDTAQPDYATLLTNIKNNSVDIMYVISTDPEQAMEILGALRNPQSVVKSFSVGSLGITMVIGNGSGFTSSKFLYNASGKVITDLENLVITMPWSQDLPWKGSAEFAAALKAFQQSRQGTTQIAPVSRVMEAYTALKVTAKALNELAQSTPDWRTKISNRDALKAFRESLAKELRAPQGSSWESLMGPIAFDTEGQNTQLDPPIVQVIQGKLQTVYPDKYKVHDVVYNLGW